MKTIAVILCAFLLMKSSNDGERHKHNPGCVIPDEAVEIFNKNAEYLDQAIKDKTITYVESWHIEYYSNLHLLDKYSDPTIEYIRDWSRIAVEFANVSRMQEIRDLILTCERR